MRGHGQGHGAEQPAGETTATAGADDGEIGILRMLDHHPRGVSRGDRRRHGDAGLGDRGGGRLGDAFDGLLHGDVEVRGIDDVGRAHVDSGDGVGGDDADLGVGPLRVRDRPLQGAVGVVGAVDADDDRMGHVRTSVW
jgi:hypothetical protein